MVRVHAFIIAVISSGVSRSAATLVMVSLGGVRSSAMNSRIWAASTVVMVKP